MTHGKTTEGQPGQPTGRPFSMFRTRGVVEHERKGTIHLC